MLSGFEILFMDCFNWRKVSSWLGFVNLIRQFQSQSCAVAILGLSQTYELTGRGDTQVLFFFFKSLASCSYFFDPYTPEEKESLLINTRSEIHWFFSCSLEVGGGDVHISVVILVFVLTPLLHFSPMDCWVIWIRAVVEGLQPSMERGRPNAPMNLQPHYKCTLLEGSAQFLLPESLLNRTGFYLTMCYLENSLFSFFF